MEPEDLDRELTALFRAVKPEEPSPAFIRKTMRAVKREPLPAGRHPLQSAPFRVLGWVAIVAGVAVSGLGLVVASPFVAILFTALVTRSLRVGVWMVQSIEFTRTLFELLTTTGLAVMRAIGTSEGMAGLLVVAVVAALSLSALRRVLVSDWEGSRWHEAS